MSEHKIGELNGSSPVRRFLATDPDDAACLEFLWRQRLSPDGNTAMCPKCEQRRRFHRVAARRSYSCDACGHHLHPTAGTIFHKSTTPLPAWFRALDLVSDAGTEVSVSRLEHELGVSHRTAARMIDLIKGAGGSAGVFGERVHAAAPVRQESIVDVAGDGLPTAEAVAAAEAQLNGLHGVAVDSDGNVYLSDYNNHLVRRIEPSGLIRTVAGCGLYGYAGDGGPAHLARLTNPSGLMADGEGGLLIADTGNHSVRRVDPSGTITTFAGCGFPGFAGDGGPALAARLHSCHRLLRYGDALLISEYRGHRIRVVDSAGVITTFAGNGNAVTSGDGADRLLAGIPRPMGMAADAEGNIYIAQGDNHSPNSRVRRISPSGTITTFAGSGEPGFDGDGGPAVAAQLDNPADVVVAPDGTVFISDYFNDCLREVDTAGRISSVAASALRLPLGLAFDNAGDLLIADTGNFRLRKLVLSN